MRGLLSCILTVILIVLSICSCDDQVECIDPDNWGGRLTTTISSNGNDGTEVTTQKPQKKQTIAWKPSYQLDGNRVTMLVKNDNHTLTSDLDCTNKTQFDQTNSWLPIFNIFLAKNSSQYNNLEICKFAPNSPVTREWCPVGSLMEYDNIAALNLPCKFNHGLGLYSTLATTPPKDDDFSCLIDGDGSNCFFHIGDNMGKSITNSNFYSQSCPTAGVSFVPPSSVASTPTNMYFKILDRYYSDNIGGYTVEFKQGVKKAGSGGIVTKFVGIVQVLLCNVTTGIYKTLVAESDFSNYIRVILVLYVMFLGFTSVMGFTQLTHKELLIRVLKIGLVVQLTSTTSWEFFNDHFFKLFTNGIQEIIGIIFGKGGDVAPVEVKIPWIDSSQGCNFQTLAGFSAIDDIINQIFSYETTRKVLSLLFWQVYGFLYIAIIYICLAVIFFILIKFVLIYIVSFLIISILITLAPIFIPFFLFGITRSFFNNWLQALISYFIQPIIILTFAFFLLQIFMAQMQTLLGYRVCWKHLFTIPVVDIDFYAWQYDFNDDRACIVTPNPIFYYESEDGKALATKKLNLKDQLKFVGNLNIESASGPNLCNAASFASTDTVCKAHTCSQNRYIGYPYLNPYFPQDQSRISELKQSPPDLISFRDIIVFAMIIWFMSHFSKMVPAIAKQVAKGNPFTGVDLGGTAGALQAAIFNSSKKTLAFIDKYTTGGKITKQLRIARQIPIGLKEYAQDFIGKKIVSTKRKIKSTASNALTATDALLSNSKHAGLRIPYKTLKFGYKSAKSVANIPKKLETLSRHTIGKSLGTIKDTLKATRDATGAKLDEKLFGNKRPERISSAALKKADEAFSEAHNKEAEAKAAKMEIEKIQKAIKEGKIDKVKGAKLLKEKKKEAEEAKKLAQKNIKEAYDQYRQAVKEGSTKAMLALGHMHEQNQVFESEKELYNNLAEAHSLYSQALNAGDMAARPEIDRVAQKMQEQQRVLKEKEGEEALKDGHEALADAIEAEEERKAAQDELQEQQEAIYNDEVQAETEERKKEKKALKEKTAKEKKALQEKIATATKTKQEKTQKAYNKYIKAVQNGNSDGMIALGNMYEENKIVNQSDAHLTPERIVYNNLSQAQNLYSQASAKGHKDAEFKAKEINEKIQKQRKILEEKGVEASSKGDKALDEIADKKDIITIAKNELAQTQEQIENGTVEDQEKAEAFIESKKNEIQNIKDSIQNKRKEAYDEYTKASHNFNSNAMMALGSMYEQNQVPDDDNDINNNDPNLDPEPKKKYENLSKAREFYEKALESKHHSARLDIDRVTKEMKALEKSLKRKD